MRRRFPRHKGITARGLFLVSFGAVYLLIGYSLLTISNAPSVQKPLHKALHLALQLAPLTFYGWLWIIAGVMVLAAGLWQPFDALGFFFAALTPSVWAAVYFSAWNTLPRAWVSAAVYLLLAVAVLSVARMADPIEVEHLRQLSRMRRQLSE